MATPEFLISMHQSTSMPANCKRAHYEISLYIARQWPVDLLGLPINVIEVSRHRPFVQRPLMQRALMLRSVKLETPKSKPRMLSLVQRMLRPRSPSSYGLTQRSAVGAPELRTVSKGDPRHLLRNSESLSNSWVAFSEPTPQPDHRSAWCHEQQSSSRRSNWR
jgi:hypothetical protein